MVVRSVERKVRILRVAIRDQPGHLGVLAKLIGDFGASIGDILKVRAAGEYNVREIEITYEDERQLEALQREIEFADGISLEEIFDPVLEAHRGGKIEIEQRLSAELPIPVMHDDQHGTGVVVLAALQNAMRATDARLDLMLVGIVGLGAAGIGIAKLLRAYGVKGLMGSDINPEVVLRFEALGGAGAGLDRVMEESQVVIATSGKPDLIRPEQVREGRIILALSNPKPEIRPERARRINDSMKIAAAETIAEFAPAGELVPNLLDPDVHHAVAEAVERAARESGANSVSEAT